MRFSHKTIKVRNGRIWILTSVSLLSFVITLPRIYRSINVYLANKKHNSRTSHLLYIIPFANALNFSQIVRVNPDLRTIVEAYRLPVSLTTSLTWAGDHLEDLIVTSSRRNLDPQKMTEEPLAGSIFILHGLGTGGVPDNLFLFNNADDY